jgi:hypothetical protein
MAKRAAAGRGLISVKGKLLSARFHDVACRTVAAAFVLRSKPSAEQSIHVRARGGSERSKIDHKNHVIVVHNNEMMNRPSANV